MGKKVIVALSIVVIILLIGIIFLSFQSEKTTECPEEDNTNRIVFSDILNKIESVLTDDWKIVGYEENTVPHGYNTTNETSTCIYVNIENQNLKVEKIGKYIHSGDYAFYYLWFAPLDWEGEFDEEPTVYQDWIPGVNITKEYKIFYGSDGDPSNMIEKIIDKFNE